MRNSRIQNIWNWEATCMLLESYHTLWFTFTLNKKKYKYSKIGSYQKYFDAPQHTATDLTNGPQNKHSNGPTDSQRTLKDPWRMKLKKTHMSQTNYVVTRIGPMKWNPASENSTGFPALTGIPRAVLYFISEKSMWKNQVLQTGLLIYFKLDFYCLHSLQKSKFWNWFLQAKNAVCRTCFLQLDFSKIKYKSTGG